MLPLGTSRAGATGLYRGQMVDIFRRFAHGNCRMLSRYDGDGALRGRVAHRPSARRLISRR